MVVHEKGFAQEGEVELAAAVVHWRFDAVHEVKRVPIHCPVLVHQAFRIPAGLYARRAILLRYLRQLPLPLDVRGSFFSRHARRVVDFAPIHW